MKPDLRDVHIYGGTVSVSVGVLAYTGWPGGLIALGVVLLYLGTYRMGRL
jgi:hypothetical protein|tara:strand:- start:445 stop:594 length:150 start_codon:yes stop_codon:yes gene_type:complete